MSYKQSLDIDFEDKAGPSKDGVSSGFHPGDEGLGGNPKGSPVTKKPDIFGYQDFRKYLTDLYAFHRRLDTKFNKSYVCRKMGLLNSRSYFNEVLHGRVVSKPKVEDFIRTFALNKLEAKYFRILVNFNQATEFREEREWYFEQLQALSGISHGPERLHLDNAFDIVCCYNSIRAVLGIADIREEFAYLANHVYPPVAAAQAEEAVRNLSRMGLIRRDERGFWKPVPG
jgi:uncharacterized protein (TIGR02147 family)